MTSSGFSFDNSGNATATGAGTSFGYNPESFLTSASVTGVGSGTYVRDAEGRRVRKTAGSTATDSFYSGSELIAEKTGSVWTDYIFFGGLRVAQVVKDGANPAVTTYLHTDHIGSVRRCTDSGGNQNGACDYEPFGEVQLGTTCSVPTDFRFAGMQWDSESQLYHAWFRAYDPNQVPAEIVKTLLRRGVNVNARTTWGWTALMAAAARRDETIMLDAPGKATTISPKQLQGQSCLPSELGMWSLGTSLPGPTHRYSAVLFDVTGLDVTKLSPKTAQKGQKLRYTKQRAKLLGCGWQRDFVGFVLLG